MMIFAKMSDYVCTHFCVSVTRMNLLQDTEKGEAAHMMDQKSGGVCYIFCEIPLELETIFMREVLNNSC